MVYFQPGPRLHLLLDALAFVPVHLFILPATALYHGIRYWLAPSARRFPHLTWWRYIVLNLQRARNQYMRGLCVNYPDPNAHVRIPSKYDDVCDVATVTLPPITEDVPRLEVLDSDATMKGIVHPTPVTGFWIAAKRKAGDLTAQAKPDERVIYFIVGGGYANGHPLDPHTAFSFAQLTGARNIVMTGDSAGANACLALTRYLDALRGVGFDWGLPRGLALHCPWGDMTSSFPSIKRNRYTDHLIDLNTTYIPSHTRHFPSKDGAYFSPALSQNTSDGHFARLAEAEVRAYVLAGTAEAFYDEIIALKAGMRAAGMDIIYREIEGAGHSDFVSMDRPGWQGWSWGVVRNDFEDFWYATAE
ncbi:hypothetical protein CcaverHIS631_0410980 [Cutaneotrichosporon cavernicola]|nr:hypothetical protein CcaverHIS631_0410980 [Cutaneotrichosporon cavernicola]BEJ07828.1 hypothetical protein CcaverHIS641_0410970 [Cutaneotrichosporon cavernicola]